MYGDFNTVYPGQSKKEEEERNHTVPYQGKLFLLYLFSFGGRFRPVLLRSFMKSGIKLLSMDFGGSITLLQSF